MPGLTTPLLATAAVALALLAAAPASAEIIPQQSIAGVSIGMTERQVVATMGEPGNVHSEYGGSGGDDFFTTYRYGKRGVKVRFIRRRGGNANRVTSVEVYKGRSELTATGIGIRSTRAEVKAQVAGSKCKRYDKWYAVCSVGRGDIGDIQTTFWLNQRDKVKLVTLSRILYD